MTECKGFWSPSDTSNGTFKILQKLKRLNYLLLNTFPALESETLSSFFSFLNLRAETQKLCCSRAGTQPDTLIKHSLTLLVFLSWNCVQSVRITGCLIIHSCLKWEGLFEKQSPWLVPLLGWSWARNGILFWAVAVSCSLIR